MKREKWLATRPGVARDTPATRSIVKSGFGELVVSAVEHVRTASTIITFQVGGVWQGTFQTAATRYDVISIPNAGSGSKKGAPTIPLEGVYVAIPDVSQNLRATVIDKRMHNLPGTFRLCPMPRHLVENKAVVEEYNQDIAIYESNDEYPGRDFDFSDIKIKKVAGATVAHLIVYFAQYRPQSGTLAVVDSLSIQISYDIPAGVSITKMRRPPAPLLRNRILDIENALDRTGSLPSTDMTPAAALQSAAPKRARASGKDRAPASAANLRVPGIRAEYVIITTDSLLNAVEPLRKAKSLAPHTAIATTTTMIKREFRAASLKESIKEFLQWSWEHWDERPQYVVLAGDIDKIPADEATSCWSTKCLSDHYYANLFGSLEPELAVARIPTNDQDIMRKVCRKLASYSTTRRRKVVLVSGSGDYRICSEEIKSEIDRKRRFKVTTLYDDQANRKNVIDKMNSGPLIVNYCGDGEAQCWASKNGLRTSDIRRLHNDRYPPMVFCVCCKNAEIKNRGHDTVVEAFLLEGKCIAVLGASDYMPTPPNDKFDRYLFQAILNEGQVTPGGIFQTAKSLMVQNSLDDQDSSQVVNMYMLFGDPSAEVIGSLP